MKANFTIYIFLYLNIICIYCQNENAQRLFNQQKYKAVVQTLEKRRSSVADEILLVKAYQKLLKFKYSDITLDKALIANPATAKDYDALLVLKLDALLKANKLSEVENILEANKSILSKNQDAFKIEKYVKEKGAWNHFTKQFQITLLKRINTKYNDYGFTNYKNEYYFVTSRDKDLINGSHVDPIMQQPFTQLHKAFKTKDTIAFKDKGMVIPKVKNAYNQGPITFDVAHGLAYYSMATSKDGVHYYNQIYKVEEHNSKWMMPSQLDFNLDQYNYLHPCISKSGDQLFFSSNMLGGFGGYDLYVVEKKVNTWGTPRNLGATINTSADEVFPFYDETTLQLYFSSNASGGMGGLDIYTVKMNEELRNFFTPFNLRDPINSNADDFAFNLMPNSNKGFFASNRSGGIGGDDIYGFSMNTNVLHAQYVLANDKAGEKKLSQAKVQLLENGKLISTAQTNKNGEIIFPMLDKEKLYTLQIDNTEQLQSAYILNLQNQPVLEAKAKEKLLIVENVSADVSTLRELNDNIEAGNMTIEAIVVSESDFDKPVKNLKIELVNDNEVVYQSRISDNKGQFMFNQLDPSSSFKFKLDEVLLNYLNIEFISIYTLDKKLLATIKMNKDKKFEFKILPADLVLLASMSEDDVPYAVNFTGYLKSGNNNQKVMKAVDVLLYNEKGELLQRTKTNQLGFFKFQKLAPDQNYFVSIDAEDPVWKDITNLSIVDQSGKVVYEQTNKKVAQLFNFPILANDQARLSLMQEVDIAYNLKIKGILFGDGTRRLPNANIFLNTAQGNMAQTKTDGDGQFTFDHVPLDNEIELAIDSNELLYKPFAELVIKDNSGKIIFKANKAKFKYTFLSSEKSSLSIQDENDDSKFIPTLLSIQILNGQGQALALRSVQLVNDRGKVVFDGTTDANGKITLSNIDLNENYNIILLTGNEKFTSALALADANGNILKRGYLAKDGVYKFTLLSTEMKEMSNALSEVATFKLINQVMNWNNIYFDFGKYEISQNSAIELDKLVSYMKLDAKIKAEIDAHTDVVSSNQFNLVLSKKRLDAVMLYIASRGIDKKRLNGKYFGETKPVQKKTSEADYTEADNNLNRRAEFKLLVK